MGYEIERFESPPPSGLICSICETICREAVSCNEEDHLFCLECITTWLAGNNQCPVDQKPLSVAQLHSSKAIAKWINRLMIKCRFSNCGCDRIITVEEELSHATECEHRTETLDSKCFAKMQELELEIRMLQDKVRTHAKDHEELKLEHEKLKEANKKLQSEFNALKDCVTMLSNSIKEKVIKEEFTVQGKVDTVETVLNNNLGANGKTSDNSIDRLDFDTYSEESSPPKASNEPEAQCDPELDRQLTRVIHSGVKKSPEEKNNGFKREINEPAPYRSLVKKLEKLKGPRPSHLDFGYKYKEDFRAVSRKHKKEIDNFVMNDVIITTAVHRCIFRLDFNLFFANFNYQIAGRDYCVQLENINTLLSPNLKILLAGGGSYLALATTILLGRKGVLTANQSTCGPTKIRDVGFGHLIDQNRIVFISLEKDQDIGEYDLILTTKKQFFQMGWLQYHLLREGYIYDYQTDQRLGYSLKGNVAF